MIDHYSWVELSFVNGQLGTYFMKKTSEPNNFSLAEYEVGDHFDEFITRFKGHSEEGQNDEEPIYGDADDKL